MAERVAVVSIAPLLPGAVHGGSQRILDGIVRGLADAGAQVSVLCSWRPENDGGVELAPGVAVNPALRLRGYFPDPWEAPPYRILESARAAGEALEWAETVYLHADTFYLRDVIPPGRRVVRSFHDFHYETALISAFGFRADLTVVPSVYLRRCIEATSGALRGPDSEPVAVVPNGIDLDTYHARPGETPAGVRPRADGDLVLLWPHRADQRKGISEAIAITASLGERLPGRNLRLLVPRHVDASTSPETRRFYDRAVADAAAAGILDSLEFTPWWSGGEMALAYSFADVTICPGSFIESFSLAAYESLACGTPVVAARVGALRDLPGHRDVRLFPFGDTTMASDAVTEAAAGMRDPDGIRRLLAERYSFGGMQRGYVEAILGGQPVTRPATPATQPRPLYALAPWCWADGTRVYNDYEYGWSERGVTGRFLAGTGDRPFSLDAALEAGVTSAQIGEALDDGVIVRA